jgi:hypothetical protein
MAWACTDMVGPVVRRQALLYKIAAATKGRDGLKVFPGFSWASCPLFMREIETHRGEFGRKRLFTITLQILVGLFTRDDSKSGYPLGWARCLYVSGNRSNQHANT